MLSDRKLWIEAIENLESVVECEQVGKLLKDRLNVLRPPKAVKKRAAPEPKKATSEVTKAEAAKAEPL